MNELKPCPFCGRTVNAVLTDENKWLVMCGFASCLAEGPAKKKRNEAIAAWNTRAPQADKEEKC